MNYHSSKKAGEVVVNSLEAMNEFEIKCVQILRHANNLFERKDFSELPETIENLFLNSFSRHILSDFISIFALHHQRPIVRHHPDCLCVGADENIFANILRLAYKNQEKEVELLGSLLIKSTHVHILSKKSKVVAFLIEEDLRESSHCFELNQKKVNNNHLN